jgi:hypothetical protein
VLRRGAAGPGLGRAVTASPHPFDRQRPGGSGRSNSPIRPGEIKPSKPVRTVKYNHLPIVDRRHVGAGLSREQREGVADWRSVCGECAFTASVVVTGTKRGHRPGTRLTSVSRNRPSVAVSHENIVVRRGRGYAQGSNYRTERQMLRAAAFWFGMAIGAGLLLELLSSAALPAGSRQEPYHEPDGGPEAQR